MKSSNKIIQFFKVTIEEFYQVRGYTPDIFYKAFLAVIEKSKEHSDKHIIRRIFEHILIITATTLALFLYLSSGFAHLIKDVLSYVLSEHICNGFIFFVALCFCPFTFLIELYLTAVVKITAKNIKNPYGIFVKELSTGAIYE